jgi:hypothetical protein
MSGRPKAKALGYQPGPISEATATATAKYRGLSTPRHSAPLPVKMMWFGFVEENRQQQHNGSGGEYVVLVNQLDAI